MGITNIDNFNYDDYFVSETDNNRKPIAIYPLTEDNFNKTISGLSDFERKQVTSFDFKAEKNQYIILLNATGTPCKILAFYDEMDVKSLIFLAKKIPQHFDYIQFYFPESCQINQNVFYQLWILDLYQFNFYKTQDTQRPKIILPTSKSISPDIISARLRSYILGRNLVNLPAEDASPAFIQSVIENIAQDFSADVDVIIGDDLKKHNYNLIHAVGRAITDPQYAPRLVHLQHNKNTDYPHLALVGKGVTFDTGGLNIKTGAYMNLMKKDMGGSACVLGIALSIMQEKLPIKLDLWIPLAENNVAGNAFRPGDIFTAHNGKTIEITNTDAEGRLLLADALCAASEKDPDYIIDIATLTGAARVAVGDDLAALFTDNQALCEALMLTGKTQNDPLWPLPLHTPYESYIKGHISDLVNSASSGFAGASTAALFLKNFVKNPDNWIHIDAYCWNKTTKPTRPQGGDVVTIRAIMEMIKNHIL